MTSIVVGHRGHQQRIDNFLAKTLKVSRSLIYRAIRKGQIRVNAKKIDFYYHLQETDVLRIPPLDLTHIPTTPRQYDAVTATTVYEDEALLVLDKPSGVASHGGSHIHQGLIESIRGTKPECPFLELVHRLDRDTSGLIMVAKTRPALLALQRQIQDRSIRKIYQTLVYGRWPTTTQDITLALRKQVRQNGQHHTVVDHKHGKTARTCFALRKRWPHFSLLQVRPITGRTHQIRVHLAHVGYPIAGDTRYGYHTLNHQLSTVGLTRLFLHAYRLVLQHPLTQQNLVLTAPLPAALDAFLAQLSAQPSTFETIHGLLAAARCQQ